MSFPSPSEYDDAIQNLSSAFIDVELKNGKNDGPLRFGVHGTVASGSFAIVYRIKCGSKRFAVKCFTSQPPENQRQRYSNIHNHLSRSKLNCSVGFQYLEDGVRVRGTTYPILKMEWMEAPTLLKHLPTQLADRERLRRLSDAFLTLSSELRSNKIAHGDLQHGNLLVSGDDLKIIDYDGMCVPGTNGFSSVENGLPPYQHPRRNGGKLNLNLDHFSSLVIWTSLYALSLDSSLWKQHIGDAERLLFKPSDFTNPQTSQIFKKLITYKDTRLTKAVSALHDACLATDLEKIPHIEDVLVEKIDWWKPDETKKSKKTDPLPDWIETDQPVPPRKNSVLPDTVAYGDSPPIGDSWITTRDNSKSKSALTSAIRNDAEQKLALAEALRLEYGKSIFFAQACVAIVICLILWQLFSQFTNTQASLSLLLLTIVLHAAGGLILTYFVYLYSNYGLTEKLKKLNSDYFLVIAKTEIVKKQLAAVKANIILNKKLKNEAAEMNLKLNGLKKQHKARIKMLDDEFSEPTTKIENDLNQIYLLEVEELNELEKTYLNEIKQLEEHCDAINTIRLAKVIAVQKKIKKIGIETKSRLESRIFEKHQKLRLKTSALIKSDSINGWVTSVSKLHGAGIENANDISRVSLDSQRMIITKASGEVVYISGISKHMTENLKAWLEGVRNHYGVSRASVSLDFDESRSIKDEESKKVSELEKKIKSIDEKYCVDHAEELKKIISKKELFEEQQAAVKMQHKVHRDNIEIKKKDCKNLYRDNYNKLIKPLEFLINDLTKKILTHERLIEGSSKNDESLEKSIQHEINIEMQNTSLFEVRIRSHKTVSYGHFLRRVFS